MSTEEIVPKSSAPNLRLVYLTVAILALMNISLLILVLHDRRHPPRFEEVNAERLNIIEPPASRSWRSPTRDSSPAPP
jgi:hypothetical protein